MALGLHLMLKLQQLLLVLIILTFPLDKVVSSSEAGREGLLTIDKILFVVLLAVFVGTSLVKRDSNLIRMPVRNFASIMLVAYIISIVISVIASPETSFAGMFSSLRLRGTNFLLLSVTVCTIRSLSCLRACVIAYALASVVGMSAGFYEAATGNATSRKISSDPEEAADNPEKHEQQGRVKTLVAGASSGGIRVHGLMGGPGLHATVMTVHLGMTLYLLFGSFSWQWKILGAVLAMGCVSNHILTASRAEVPALILLLAVFWYFVEIPRKRLLLVLAVAALVTCCVLALLFFPDVALQRFVEQSQGAGGHDIDGGLDYRLQLLRVCWNMGSTYPLFGIGAGNFQNLFMQYREGTDLFSAYPAPSHNVPALVFAETGTVGLTFYLLTFFATIKMLLDSIRLSPNAETRLLAVVILASFVGFLGCLIGLPVEGLKYGWILVGFAGAVLEIARQERSDLRTDATPLVHCPPSAVESAPPISTYLC